MVRLRPVWMTNHPPSVLWHCWLGHQNCKNRRPYNLYCVGTDVKPCSINQSIWFIFTQYQTVESAYLPSPRRAAAAGKGGEGKRCELDELDDRRRLLRIHCICVYTRPTVNVNGDMSRFSWPSVALHSSRRYMQFTFKISPLNVGLLLF